MISYEIIHYLNRKKRGKEGHMALKLDMSKAFDRVEWGYLRVILSKMGFNEWWVHLILQCVTTVSYQITHNRRKLGPVIPSRGIRQGDPLSPYLFIICSEGLSALIKHYEAQKWIHGAKICRSAPSITHMLFADDSFIYYRANEEEILKVKELLVCFEIASGQKVNFQKSYVHFSKNVREASRNYYCQRLQMVQDETGSSYLGLPSMMDRSKTTTLGYIKDKVRNKLQNWDGRWFSQAGKEILVKAVLQAVPTYTMSVFLLPVKTIQKLEKMFSKFWWGSNANGTKKIHWMNWSKLCRHKAVGGMGFRDLRDLNIAMLGKQAWRFVTQPNSLVSQLYKAKYFSQVNFLNAQLGNNPSFIWRSIWEARAVILA